MGLVCFEGGTRAVYEGDLPEPKIPMPSIYGTEGQIKVSSGGVIQAGTVLLLNQKESDWQEIEPEPVETNQVQELIDWMEGKVDEHRSSGRQARYTIEIMMAIYESLRINNVVNMPLETRESPLDLMIEDGTLVVTKEGRYDIRKPFPEENK